MVRRSSPRGGSAMSPLMRSKPASESSPVTGDAPDPAVAVEPAGAEPGAAPPPPIEKPRAARSGRTEIELEVSRGRSLGWAIFGLVIGALMIWQLGAVGVWGGGILVVLG